MAGLGERLNFLDQSDGIGDGRIAFPDEQRGTEWRNAGPVAVRHSHGFSAGEFETERSCLGHELANSVCVHGEAYFLLRGLRPLWWVMIWLVESFVRLRVT